MTIAARVIDPEYLERNGVPTIGEVAQGVLAIISGDGQDTVDLTYPQAAALSRRLQTILEIRGGYLSE